MSAKDKTGREQRAEELDKWYKQRRVEGLPAHRAQEHHGSVEGLEIDTLAGVTYLSFDGAEVELSSTGVINLVGQLQAAQQAVA